VPPAPDPKENLAQQLRILSHAQAFIGTYGGLAQTALRLGVPSVSFWREFGGTAQAHLHLSDTLAKKTQTPFLAGSIEDGQSWRKVIGGIPLVPARDAMPMDTPRIVTAEGRDAFAPSIQPDEAARLHAVK
jgi:hypothetical protein